ncbi:F-actin-capping protein subunit alpha [Xylographa parallela]|nr:F-actin-capping protein subunit alpha [Xylographa parallela]
MSSANIAAVSAFVEGAPPGELADVIADIKALTVDEPQLLQSASAAFEKYNEAQLTTVKLPGGSQNVPGGRAKQVLVTPYNSLGGGRYYDVASHSSFAFDHTTQVSRPTSALYATTSAPANGGQKASAVQAHTLESPHTDLMYSGPSPPHASSANLTTLRSNSLLKAVGAHAAEHYTSSTYSVCPTAASDDRTLAILLVANKYSPSNFWYPPLPPALPILPLITTTLTPLSPFHRNGRWRTTYLLTPTASPPSLSGTLQVDVHYYEDGNVRLTSTKPLTLTLASASATEVVRQMALAERRYQEELNRGFAALSEGAFKGLRRQLPVTRQKVEWEKVGGYRLGQEIGGGRAR